MTRATPAAVQWWFSALDQKLVAVGAERWIAQVVGIHIDGPDLWIQLAAASDPSRSAVLHVTAGMRMDDALARIEAVGTGTDPSGRVQRQTGAYEAAPRPLLPRRAQPVTVRHLRGIATASGASVIAAAERADERSVASSKIIQMAKKLYMIVEHFKGGDAAAVYRRFRDRGRLVPDGVSYISSWVDSTLKRCYQLMETDNPALLDEWMANWRDLVDFEVHAVMTSADAAELIAPRL